MSKIAKTQKIDVFKLGRGQYVIFLNRKKDRIKLFAVDNILAYLRQDKPIDMQAIQKIPRAFEGNGKIEDDADLKKFMEQALKTTGKKRNTVGPLEQARAIKKAGLRG